MSVNEIVTNVVINATTTGVAKTTKQLDSLAAASARIPSYLKMPVLDKAPLKSMSAYQRAMLGVNETILSNATNATTAKKAISSVFKSAGNQEFATSILKANQGWKDTVAFSKKTVANIEGATEALTVLESQLRAAGISGSKLSSMMTLAKASYATLAAPGASYGKAEAFAAKGGGDKLITTAQSGVGAATKSLEAQAAKDVAKAARDAAAEEKRLAQAEAAAARAAAKAAAEQKKVAEANAKTAGAASTLSAALNKQNGITAATTGGFFRLRAVLSTVVMGFFLLGRALKSWFEMASAYAETNHLLYATLANDLAVYDDANGRALQATDLFGRKIESSQKMTNESASAIEGIVGELDKMSDRLQVDPTNLKKTYATFYEMANSAGMAADKVHEVAKGMSQLTYDVGSLWDEDFESVAKKMRSALGGITTSVRLFGIDISRSAADTYLMEHGIDAAYNSLDRASKMLVIYNMLLKGTTTDQDDLARSAAQPANLLRILGEQAQYAGRMLGAAIFPVITPLIALFYNLMKAIQAAAQALSSFLSFVFGGWYTAASDGWNSFLGNLKMGGAAAEEVEEGMDGIASGAGGAADAAKELKKQLMGFDEINNITPETDTSGGGGGGGGGAMPDGGVDIWEKMSESLDDVRSKIMEFANNAVPALLAAIAAFVSGFGDGFLGVFKAIAAGLAVVSSALNVFVDFLRKSLGEEAFDGFVSGVGKILGTVAGLTVVSKIFGSIRNVIEGLVKSSFGSTLAKMFGEVTGAFRTIPAILSAGAASGGVFKATFMTFETMFANIAKMIFGFLGPVGTVLTVIGLLAEGFMYCYNNSEPFRNAIDALITKFTEFTDTIGNLVTSALTYLSDAFADFGVSLPVEPLDILCGVFVVLATVVETVAEVIIGAFGGVVSFFAVAVGAIANFINNIISFFGGMSESGINNTKNMKMSVLGAFDNMEGGVIGTVMRMWDSVSTWFSNMKNTVVTTATNIWTSVTSVFTSIRDTISNVFSTVFDIISSPFIRARDAISDAIDTVRDILSGSISFPHIELPHFNISGGQLPWGIGGSGYPPSVSVSWYAKGGIATKASLAGIGEAGDEGIIPLQGARMKPFALAISDNINKYGTTTVSQSDRETLGAILTQSELLRDQNDLLRQILAKDTTLSIDGREIINSINRQQRIQGRQLIGV